MMRPFALELSSLKQLYKFFIQVGFNKLTNQYSLMEDWLG